MWGVVDTLFWQNRNEHRAAHNYLIWAADGATNVNPGTAPNGGYLRRGGGLAKSLSVTRFQTWRTAGTPVRRAIGGAVLCCSGWPRSNECADLPVVPARVGDATEPSAVFVPGRRGHGGGGEGGADDGVRVAGFRGEPGGFREKSLV
jgi:hypothetical protein